MISSSPAGLRRRRPRAARIPAVRSQGPQRIRPGRLAVCRHQVCRSGRRDGRRANAELTTRARAANLPGIMPRAPTLLTLLAAARTYNRWTVLVVRLLGQSGRLGHGVDVVVLVYVAAPFGRSSRRDQEAGSSRNFGEFLATSGGWVWCRGWGSEQARNPFSFRQLRFHGLQLPHAPSHIESSAARVPRDATLRRSPQTELPRLALWRTRSRYAGQRVARNLARARSRASIAAYSRDVRTRSS